MKKTIAGIGIAATLIGGGLAVDTVVVSEEEIIREVAQSQSERPVQIKKTERGNYVYEVHEYKAPGGEGYQLLIRNKRGCTKSIGYGVEAQSRTSDWFCPDNTASSTPR